MTTVPTERNTKAQILAAYNALLKEQGALEKQIEKLQKEKTNSSLPITEKRSSTPVNTMGQQQTGQDKLTATINTLVGL